MNTLWHICLDSESDSEFFPNVFVGTRIGFVRSHSWLSHLRSMAAGAFGDLINYKIIVLVGTVVGQWRWSKGRMALAIPASYKTPTPSHYSKYYGI